MFNAQVTKYAALSDFEPDYLRHVSDDVTAHWDECDKKVNASAPNMWKVFAFRLFAAHFATLGKHP